MNYLWELYYGGWAAPNIYYLGHAGVVKFGGIRIGGLSGIFNGRHYKQVRHALRSIKAKKVNSAHNIRIVADQYQCSCSLLRLQRSKHALWLCYLDDHSALDSYVHAM